MKVVLMKCECWNASLWQRFIDSLFSMNCIFQTRLELDVISSILTNTFGVLSPNIFCFWNCFPHLLWRILICGTQRPTDQSAIDPKVPLTIGYLSSYLSSKMTLGAIPLAIETINNDPNLLPGRKLQFVAADIGDPGIHDCLLRMGLEYLFNGIL